MDELFTQQLLPDTGDSSAVDQMINDELRRQKKQQSTVVDTQAPNKTQPGQSQGQSAGTPQAQPQKPQEEAPKKDLMSQAGDAVRNVAEGALAAPTGVVDFGVDLINKIPLGAQFKVPKIPAFKNEVLQGLREAASIIIPTVIAAKALKGAGTKAQSIVGSPLGKDAVVKFVSNLGIDIGTGAAVDYVASPNEKDDNLAGTLKKTWPDTFGWISDDWATVDGDSPEVFREKNVKEGASLGAFVGLGEAAAKIIRGLNKSKYFLEAKPLDAKAKKFWSEAQKSREARTDPIEKSVIDTENAIDELGVYRFLKNEGVLDQPTFGITDTYNQVEKGIRTIDELGVVGAQVDAARIQNNIGTQYGRLRNFISESALKYGLNGDNATKRTVVKGVQEQIRDSGKFDFLVGNKVLKQAQIDAASDELAKNWYDARLDVDQMKKILEPFQYVGEYGVKQLNSVGYSSVMKLMRQYLDDYVSLDSIRAAGLAATQKAGQLADTAEGIRLMEGTDAITRGQEQILDIMEYLLVEKGIASYMRGQGLANLNIWKRIRNLVQKDQMAEEAMSQTEEFMAKVTQKSKATVDDLRQMSKERPEFLAPLVKAWEFTDGNVDTIDKLNNYVSESLVNVKKAFFDQQPEIPNVIVQGAWSNIMNSTLSAFGTVSKAFWSNAVLGMLKPVTIMAGAAARGDIETVKRAWFMYSAMHQTLGKGLSHMALVFRKAARDPKSVEYIMRDDLALKNQQQFEILESFAVAAQQRGEDGPMALYEFAKNIDDMANHPLLRLGSNGLTATDGFTRAVMGHAESRFQLYEKHIRGGNELDASKLKDIEEKIYQKMFDSNGLITNEAIKYATDEIAMNLDNFATEALSTTLKTLPILKPFMLFPRTSINLINIVDKFSPISVFMREYNELAKPWKYFSDEDIKAILKKRDIPADEFYRERFDMLRAETLGRKAVGATLILSAGFMFMNDSLTGDGFYDPERQKTREGLGWTKRSYKGIDGKWHTYDNLGPISDWLASVATTMDNFDTLDPNDSAISFSKAMFLLGAALTGKTPLSGLEPIFDILQGNPAAANRWAASFSNNIAPLGSARAEFGRVLSDGLRELDLDYFQLLRNRNNYLDLVDKNGALPYKYSWISGKKITTGESFWTRAFNVVFPMKTTDDPGPEAKFLMDIEFDARPTFMKSSQGVEYSPKEREKLFSLMGQQGYFRQAVARIMKQPLAQDFRNKIQSAERLGPVDYKQYGMIHSQINTALRTATRMAEAQLPNADEIRNKAYQEKYNQILNQQGQPGTVLNLTNK